MLSREVMGGLALAILWVNTLLVAAAAFKRALELGRLGNSFGDVVRGKVARGDGEGGAIAELAIEQVGRLMSGEPPVIAFHDRSHTCRIHGGAIALESGAERNVAASAEGEVWIDATTMAEAARSASDGAFEETAAEAKKARGLARTVRAPLAPGHEVYVGTRIVSTIAPRTWVAQRVSVAYLFVVGEVLVAALCTAAALHAPVFGTVSKVGAASAFVFFLLVQPLGTAVRDMLRPPSRALRKDAWAGRRTASVGSSEAARDSSG